MLFKMISDVEFNAENLDEAFLKLSNHFKGLIDLESSEHEVISLFTGGSISLEEIKSDEIS